MKLLSTQNQRKRDPQLNRDDWIVAALGVLIDDGVEAVQITRLARDLGVTRGSYYWHFKGRKDLLSALLEEWSARNTGVMVDVLKNAKSLDDGVLDLFSVWVGHSRFSFQLDQAIRDWGRRDTVVREILSKEDDDRVEAIAAFYERHGYVHPESFIRARVIYFTQLSYYVLNISEPMEKRVSYLAAYFQCFTGRNIDQRVADEFSRRFLALERKQ
ncbi:MAG: TetR/AcrR family transcriptional regulator [Alphaproteobacteria bacterium]|nr:TetR/AcrR family transcriptional regulator [Alphaproteobacteria bacterium]